MQDSVPSPTTKHILTSTFARSLDGKVIGTSQAQMNELLTGHAILYRRLQRSLSRFIRTLEKYEADRTQEGWQHSHVKGGMNVIDDYLESVYNAAELYEFYEKKIIRFLNPPKETQHQYRADISRIKREVSIICNHCKHNLAFLQIAEIIYEDDIHAVGFILYKMQGNRARISTEVHQNREAFSFNWAARRLVGSLIAAETLASKLVHSVPNDRGGERLSSRYFALPLRSEVKRIINRNQAGMPLETQSPIIIESENNDIIVYAESRDIRQTGKAKFRVYLDIIAQSIEVEIPYISNVIHVNVETDRPGPIYGYLHASVAAELDVGSLT